MFKSGIIYHPCPYTYNKSYYDAKFGDRRGYYGKTKSIDNQIEGLNEQINKVQSKLDILLKQREVLLSKNRKEEISELLLYWVCQVKCVNFFIFLVADVFVGHLFGTISQMGVLPACHYQTQKYV